MKITRLLNSFILIPGQDIVKNLLAFFRFTETDACTILSAYGFHGFEVGRLQNDRANKPKETSEMPDFQVYCPDEFGIPRTIPERESPEPAQTLLA